MKITVLKIKDAIVELTDYSGDGQGQIKIHTPERVYSHYWGSMGTHIVDFVTHINQGYFLSKLNPRDNGDFCPRKTLRNIRKFIKHEVPWYQDIDAQKELRQELKEIESGNENLALYVMNNLSVTDAQGDQLREAINTIKADPWHFLGRTASAQDIWLGALFRVLQKQLRRLING